jgi:hypothetical protein
MEDMGEEEIRDEGPHVWKDKIASHWISLPFSFL